MTNSDFIEQTRLLVARTQQGDHKSFAQLYDMYVNQLFNFGLRLTTDRELLKDCIHDVFVKIYVKREELSEVVNFRSYLFISLKNRNTATTCVVWYSAAMSRWTVFNVWLKTPM